MNGAAAVFLSICILNLFIRFVKHYLEAPPGHLPSPAQYIGLMLPYMEKALPKRSLKIPVS